MPRRSQDGPKSDRTQSYTRREFAAAAGTAGLALAALGGAPRAWAAAEGDAAAPARKDPMNVVIITTDDNDAEALGCFGCPLPDITPRMDALAAGGMRFAHAHTVSPTCQPTRLSLMTGRYPQTNGNTGHVDPLKPGVPTLATELKRAGYYTAIVGKQSNYLPNEAFDWDRYGETADAWEDDDGYWGMWRNPEGMHRGTLELIGEAREQGKPFFLHMNTSDPHRPWPGSVDEVWQLEMFEKQWGGKRPKPLRPYPKNYSPWEVPVPAYLADLPGVRVDVAQYYSGMHQADLAVGRVLDALEETGEADNTVVVCFGDQGAPFPGSKQNLYDVSTRIPLLIRWPGVTPAGAVADHTMVEVVDLMPTLLEGLGLPLPEGMDGRSVLPVLRGERTAAREYVQKSYNYALPGVQAFPMRAVQSLDYLFIWNAWPGERNIDPDIPLVYDGHIDPLTGLCWKSMKEAAERDPELAKRVEFLKNRVPEEFYNLQTDPYCLTNLIDAPEHKARIDAMRDMVVAQMERTDDPLLAKYHGTGPIPPEWRTLKRN